VRHRFVDADGDLMGEEEYLRRNAGAANLRAWSCFCAFYPGIDAETMRGRFIRRHVEVVPSSDPAGVWVRSGHWDLENAMDQIGDV